LPLRSEILREIQRVQADVSSTVQESEPLSVMHMPAKAFRLRHSFNASSNLVCLGQTKDRSEVFWMLLPDRSFHLRRSSIWILLDDVKFHGPRRGRSCTLEAVGTVSVQSTSNICGEREPLCTRITLLCLWSGYGLTRCANTCLLNLIGC
jgi:hypothetical protein